MMLTRSDAPVPAVVVGLDCITGLQTARILATRGVPVVGVAADRRHFASYSRAVSQLVIAPTAGEPLLDALDSLARTPVGEQPAVLFPCTDAAVATLSAGRDRLAGRYRLLLPAHEIVERLMDKRAFGEYAQAHGLPIPRTITLRTRKDAELAANELTFPVALKPALKTPRWQQCTPAKAFRAADRDSLLDLYDRCAPWTDELIAQEWIVGDEDCLYSCNVYFDTKSRPLATFVARKLRQWPVQTGTSCLGEEVRDDEVLTQALRLFQGAGFHGLAYVEMKRDERTGRYAIIEPNVGRPTGRSAIAEAGGVELLLTAYRDAVGLPLPTARVQAYGHAKWIYFRHDLQAAMHHWRHGSLSLREYLRSISGPKVDAVWALTDPLPFLLDFWRAARKRLPHTGAGPAKTARPVASPAGTDPQHGCRSDARGLCDGGVVRSGGPNPAGLA